MINITLKNALAARSISQSELASLTGIRWDTISGMCNGRVKAISLHNLNLVCAVLECQPADIIQYIRTDADPNHTGLTKAEYLAAQKRLYPNKGDAEILAHWA